MFEKEKKLLLSSAKSRPEKIDFQIIKNTLNNNLDWNFLISGKNSPFLIPLLHKNLIELKKKIPLDAWQQIEKKTRKNAGKNLIFFSYAKELLFELDKKNIKTVFLKGISVAKNFEDDTLKVLGDIDLIVKKKNIDIIEKVLFKLNWIAPINYQKIKEERLKTDYELPPFNKGIVTLDIHFHPMDFYEVNSNELFETAKKFDLEGFNAKMLSPENQIVYLCMHSALSHGFEFIVKDLVDLNETITFFNKKIDWGVLSKKSNELKANSIVFHCLSLSKQLLGTKIPEKFMEKLKKKSSSTQLFLLNSLNEKSLFDFKEKKSFLIKFLISFLIRPTAKKKMWFIFYTIFPTTSHLTKVDRNLDFNNILLRRMINPARIVLKLLRVK